jgi:hypothetical protein
MEHVTSSSPRLGYRVLDERDLDAFHALITDAHVSTRRCACSRSSGSSAAASSRRFRTDDLVSPRGLSTALLTHRAAMARPDGRVPGRAP